MIARLKRRPRLDRLRSEKRSRRRSAGRWFYLALLCLLGLWLFDLAVGDVLFLRAEGFVLRKQHFAAAPFTARIAEVDIEQGQEVSAGFRMLKVHSPEFSRDLAQLATRVADLEIRLAELQSSAEVLKAVLPFAEKRADKAREVIKIFESERGRQHVTSQRMAAALRDELDAVAEFQRVSSEYRSITSRLAQVEGALARAQQALEATVALYGDGEIDAPQNGTVVDVRAAVGEIVKAGDPIVEILSGPSYVLAYVTPGTLFEIRQGDLVTVGYGIRTIDLAN